MRRIRRSLSVARLDPVPVPAGLSNKVTTTPLLVQDGFGYGGSELPADGLDYCGPTAVTMSLLWLGKNGWNQIGPAAPTQSDALNLDLLLGGLADTSPLDGTGSDELQAAVATYLNAVGIPSTAFSYPSGYNQPTVDAIAKLNQNQTVVTLLLGWYVPDSSGSTTYERTGGHFVAVLGQEDANPNELTIGNPCPSSLKSVPDLATYALQRLATSNFTGTSPDLPAQPAEGTYYLQFPDITWPGSTQAVTPILETVYALTVDISEQSSNGPAPAQWSLDETQTIDTNGANLTVLAPLAGAGGLVQQGSGGLTLTSANATSGSNQVGGGSLASGYSSGSPFGAGSLAMNGGTLVVDPGNRGGVIRLSVANGENAQLSFSGPTALQLIIGNNNSVAVSLGGPASGNGPGLVQTGTGMFIISVDLGAAGLGLKCTVTVPAGIGVLAPASSPITVPCIVAQSPQSGGVLDFLSYGESGFVLPAYTSSTQTPINAAAAPNIYSLDNDQTLNADAIAAVFALRAGSYTINSAGANAVLAIGSQQAGEVTGLILNGEATLTGFELDFGAADVAIYASGNAQIAATISGSGQVSFFGPTGLSLSGTNTYTGETLVQSGWLNVSGSGWSGTDGSVVVQEIGTLNVEGTVNRAIYAQDGGTVILQSGTASGSLDVDSQSTLGGVGTISGTATVDGQILAGSSLGASPGVIEFQGAATFTAPLFIWTLFALEDNSTVGQDPAWNSLLFTTSDTSKLNIGGEDSRVQVLLDMTRLGPLDPNSDNAFWTKQHTWTLFEVQNGGFNVLWYAGLPQPQFKMGYFTLSCDDNLQFLYVNFVPSVVGS